MTSDFNPCYLCGHGLAKHRIVRYTPTELSISCNVTGERNEEYDECGCNGGFKTTVKIKFEESK